MFVHCRDGEECQHQKHLTVCHNVRCHNLTKYTTPSIGLVSGYKILWTRRRLLETFLGNPVWSKLRDHSFRLLRFLHFSFCRDSLSTRRTKYYPLTWAWAECPGQAQQLDRGWTLDNLAICVGLKCPGQYQHMTSGPGWRSEARQHLFPSSPSKSPVIRVKCCCIPTPCPTGESWMKQKEYSLLILAWVSKQQISCIARSSARLSLSLSRLVGPL